jgi:hypothetical protein
VTVREADPRSHRGDAEGTGHELRVLRARWRTASIAAGWRFPSDWGVPEVDAVCLSAIRRGDLVGALSSLGRARAEAGAGLDETLTDLAALHAVLTNIEVKDGLIATDPNAAPTNLVRALGTHAYLRTRVGEVYRAAARAGMSAAETHALLVVTLDLSAVTGWPRLMAMVLVADALREIFDGGESIAILGPSVAVVLADREHTFGDRALSAGWLIAERLAVDPQLESSRKPVLRLERLPGTQEAARELLMDISRA